MLSQTAASTEVAFTEAFKSAFGFAKKVRYKPDTKEVYLTKIADNAREMGMATSTYFAAVFTWVKRRRKNPNQLGMNFYGGDVAKSIVHDELIRMAKRYHEKTTTVSVKDFVEAEVEHSLGLLKAFPLPVVVNRLSPYYLAVSGVDMNLITPDKLVDVSSAKRYLDRVPGLVDFARKLVTCQS